MQRFVETQLPVQSRRAEELAAKSVKKANGPGLFERWIAIERATGRTTGEIIESLNAEAGTRYVHNWPSMMAKRGTERIPNAVRRYMMRKVLDSELKKLGIHLDRDTIDDLVLAQT